MTIDFDAEKHVYTVDGVTVPGVTELCAPLGADYDEPTDDYLDLAIDAATERGITMHDYIAFRLGGGDPEDYEMPDVYADYAEGVEMFLGEHEIIPYSVETPIATPKIAGTPDLTCEFDGDDAILDWKFVSQIAKSKVMAQLGGYKTICEYNGFYPSKLAAVQFLPGSYRLYEIDANAAKHAFSLMCEVYDVKTQKHPRGRIGG